MSSIGRNMNARKRLAQVGQRKINYLTRDLSEDETQERWVFQEKTPSNEKNTILI